MFTNNLIAFQAFIITIILLAAIAVVLLRKLSISAAITGSFLAILIFYGTGWISLLLMTVFFVLSTIATGWKSKTKEQLHIAERNKGKRKANQVVANAGFAVIISIFALIYPEHLQLFQLLVAACFSSAIADTLSSELGNVYGRRFYNIITFKKDKRGLDGVISFEGTAFGFAGSVIIAGIYSFYATSFPAFFIITIAGTVGNFSDSFLGAALERKGYLKNNVVNFLNTLIASLVALLMYLFV
ncbi:MAG: DUF92 domain-containing protein [Ilyomonas sp.]